MPLRPENRTLRARRFLDSSSRTGAAQEERSLTDVIFCVATAAFFLLAIGYLRACERLK
jgi:hypothetical protein